MLERTYSPDLRLPLRPRRLIFHDKPQQTVSVKTLSEIKPGPVLSRFRLAEYSSLLRFYDLGALPPRSAKLACIRFLSLD